MKNLTRLCLFSLVFAALAGPLCAPYRESVGWNRLLDELGEDAPTGRQVKVSMIESAAMGNYQPDTGNFDFAGKTFTMKSPESGASSHATVVAQRFFGNSMSMAGGIDTIAVYEAVDWLLDSFLRPNQDVWPTVETSRIQNHSWAGSFQNHDRNIQASRRLDFAIERDRFLAVVALRNDTNAVPPLLAHAYNGLVVGRMDGTHSRGGAWFDEPGRIRPDLVAPGGIFTSYSAPVVSSAAALLLEEADRNPGFANARRNPQVLRAILLAGASKDPFAGWSRTEYRSMDAVFGAGRLDIFNSYRILAGGEHAAGGAAPLAGSGWSLGRAASGETAVYSFAFDSDQETFAAHLAWHRLFQVPKSLNFLDAEGFVPRLEMRLFLESEGYLGEEIQASVDPVNNNQHLFVRNLPAGEYVLRVERIDTATPLEVAYGLAWDAAPGVLRPPVTFANWKRRYFLPGERDDSEVSGPLSDPDGDGVKNILEYALGRSPLTPSAEGLPSSGTVEVNGEDYLTLIFRRPSAIDDIDYAVAVSANLLEWSRTAAWVSTTPFSDTLEEVVYRHPDPIGDDFRGFLRLEVSFKNE